MTRVRLSMYMPPVVAAKLAIISAATGEPPSRLAWKLLAKVLDESIEELGLEPNIDRAVLAVTRAVRDHGYLSEAAAREVYRAAIGEEAERGEGR